MISLAVLIMPYKPPYILDFSSKQYATRIKRPDSNSLLSKAPPSSMKYGGGSVRPGVGGGPGRAGPAHLKSVPPHWLTEWVTQSDPDLNVILIDANFDVWLTAWHHDETQQLRHRHFFMWQCRSRRHTGFSYNEGELQPQPQVSNSHVYYLYWLIS